jgi:glutamate-1-semialdehyde 2,1-aminomutase
MSWGANLHGHAHPGVVSAVHAAAKRGLGFGAPTAAETELAELLCKALPSMDQVRLVTSGTEACMSALRLARAATGRELIIKCDGCYHGHSDPLLVAAGSGCATMSQPDSLGVPRAFAEQTISVPFNDLAAAERIFVRHQNRIAAFIVEPVAGNMGLVLPRSGYLEGLRKLCTTHGALLVFDEVMTGFRVGWGGWQTLCGVKPDLTCLGKVIGGGLPLAAYGGRQDLMVHLAPLGGCYQAGTLSGNPVAVAAGLASLKLAAKPGFYARHTAQLTAMLGALRDNAHRRNIPLQFQQAGLMWGYFFSRQPVVDMASAMACDQERWKTFCSGMIHQGIYLPPSPFEACFWSAAHGKREVTAITKAFAAVE